MFLVYACACAFSWWFAYQLRFDFGLEPLVANQCLRLLGVVIVIKLLLLLASKQFESLLSYFGLPDAQRIFMAMVGAALVIYGFRFVLSADWSAPRAVVLGDFLVSFSALATIRLGLRTFRERFQEAGLQGRTARMKRVGIIGAGDAGAALARELSARPGLGLRAFAFADDNPKKWKTSIHGVAILGSPEYLIAKAEVMEIDEIVIAMPSAPSKRIKEIVTELNREGIKFAFVPSTEQLLNEKVRVSHLRPVEIEDLLGRTQIDLEAGKIQSLIQGKTVMVTGGGGSIGSELCLQIQRYSPKQLIIVEQCEVQIFRIQQILIEAGAGPTSQALVADILDERRMRMIFSRHRPQVIFHAAAHKHVPMMEDQPAEAVHNNTIGTMRLADLALEYEVEHFLQVSTDKAINPTSVMGATKRLAELYIQALANRYEGRTRFMAVRFGNVLGSSGSVIPIFKRQIADGGPVTVTHPDVTRYFMTVHEAVGLVLQSAAQGEGGEIFVLDMGDPLKIADVARQLIQLSGLEPDLDIEIKFVGLRPGEKLYEELNHSSENTTPTQHPKIMRFKGPAVEFSQLREALVRLSNEAFMLNPDDVKLRIREIIPEYQPYLAIR